MKQWSTQTAIEHPEQLVGTGEFVVKAYQPAERLVLAANPYYWKADSKGQRLPYLDFFIVQYVATAEMETTLFATGKSDSEWNPGVAGTDRAWVEKTAKTYGFTIHDMGPLPDAIFYYFNLDPGSSKDGKPYVTPYKLAWFSNKLFRQAIMYAFNREGVAKGVYFGLAEPEDSIINRGNPHWYDPNVRKYSYDPQKARDLLKEAGFSWDTLGNCVDKDGNKVAFELMLAEGTRRAVDISTVLKENLSDIGIDLKITYVEGSLVMQKVTNTFDYEFTLMGWGDQAGEVDPSGNDAMFRSTGEDHFWHIREKSPVTPWEKQVDDLMDASERTFDPAERHHIFNEIQEIYSEELPLLFVVTPHEFEGIKDKWQNVKVPPSGSIIWNIDELWTDNPK
jgi:peptide/nickel transport system substrate-binding protein